MAWDKDTGDALGLTAKFMRGLRALKPGERIVLRMQEFQDMELPIPPGERWTWDEKAEWFRSRAPFYCTAWNRAEDGAWVFQRQDWR